MTPYDISNMPRVLPIVIGHQTETGVESVGFDCSAWLTRWPDMTLEVWVTAPGGDAAYQAQTHTEDGVIVWDVSASDTITPGEGAVCVMGYTSDKRKLSASARTRISPSIISATADPPESQQPWFERAMGAVEGVPEAINTALQAAKESGEFDGEKGADGISPTVTVEDIEGGHRVTITDKDGDKTFEVMDGEDGAGGGSAVQADWDASEGEAGFILNRPFYKYTQVTPRKDFLQGTYTSEPQEELLGAFAVAIDSATKENLFLGRKYTVLYNRAEYNNLTEHPEVVPGWLCYGNLSFANSLTGMEYEDTGEPFLIAVANAVTFLIDDYTRQMTNEWEMYATPVYNEEIVKIPVEYMPFGGVGTGAGAEIFNDHSNIASGNCSHAEGFKTVASGYWSHAEGNETVASGNYSHAEGAGTIASGGYSHAEGFATEASGNYSHAEGYETVASGNYSHAQGRYNIPDPDGVYAHIVGNGIDFAHNSNAHTLDWDGNAWYQGTVESAGLILTSPNGTRYKITVNDDGTLSSAAAE